MIYQLTKKQEEFIGCLLMENFSPSFGGMLKRVLHTKKYNETERTRIKEIRLSYIKKKIKPTREINKMIDDLLTATQISKK
jgi:hypothetical protein